MNTQDCEGFSLLEVIIAMAVFTIGAVGLYAMQFNSAKGNTRANQQSGAVAAASQVVEQLMRADYTDGALSVTMKPDGTPVTSPHTPHTGDELPNLKVDQAPYIELITWDVYDLGAVDSEIDGTKLVDLTVQYVDGREVNFTFFRIAMI